MLTPIPGIKLEEMEKKYKLKQAWMGFDKDTPFESFTKIIVEPEQHPELFELVKEREIEIKKVSYSDDVWTFSIKGSNHAEITTLLKNKSRIIKTLNDILDSFALIKE